MIMNLSKKVCSKKESWSRAAAAAAEVGEGAGGWVGLLEVGV